MVAFAYVQAASVAGAIATRARHRSDGAHEAGTDFFAGGTDLMQLMGEHLRNPDRIIDITALPGLDGIEMVPGALRLGALVRMSDAAMNPTLRARYPVVTEALLASASPQVRNLATLGGNLLQRTRCGYFRDPGTPCNKREPGTGCPAIDGQNRFHAVLGGSGICIATYSGDLANALLVLDANVRIAGLRRDRVICLADLHRAPGDTPEIETQLEPGELILSIDIPTGIPTRRSHYLKVRDRASFEWSIASAAVALDLADDGTVRDARIAVGGVATKPWRLQNVEASLKGSALNISNIEAAAAHAADGAVSHGANAYKIELIRRTVVRALSELGALS
ncbi:FAD binding domain-containing protein [Burkholderia sp. PAMC 26561]|uniref:FAD binding domain-containing protein n=1 Tax=Burkholderia sp. PAMC 26561 TaxID=1795043 RepID=UPI00076B1EB0|nr:xanthine dehydrogenase family protein subunit M [Burkholderia sp. PAMC 26561]AME26854.1 FAD-binding molybdopterin dehydrogenase [Burkholderia sp. PAMC 26561]AME28001.1 FAD-binding molybdopterin dehydrogenase [Burkholderia sp. PAMC 26561]